VENQMQQQAFVLRMSPSGIDRVGEALTSNQIIIGWAEARGLLDENLSWEEFRGIVSDSYYAEEDNLRRAGNAAGQLWAFVREMKIGDLVVVPYWAEFYVAEVTDKATHDDSKVDEDTAYRRNVKWLNEKRSIPRALAKSALISRMKTQGTCAYASDLLPQIKECIEIARAGSKPTFQGDLQARLIRETLVEIRSGRMDSFGFENLIRDVLVWLGADEARVVPRAQDKGADIVATFKVAGAFRQILAVQAKHWQPEPPVGKEVVEQLIKGIAAESASLGMIVTSGSISEEATSLAERFFEEKGIKIELVDGEQFAKLMIEHGIKTS
jgi:predicted Mrr-cat superfamily restriction endonuclease